MTPRETELRARVAELEAAGRPLHEVREAVAELAAEVARRVARETAAEARRRAITSASLSAYPETMNPSHRAAVALEGHNCKG